MDDLKYPKISVIMTVYNGGRYLDDSISSILCQTFKDFEFIIIIDPSTDNSLEIIKKYQAHDKRIVLIENMQKLGFTKSLNVGLKKATGNYIARLDADDISLPNRLEFQYNYLKNNCDIFLVGSSALIIDDNGKNIGQVIKQDDYRRVGNQLPKNNCMIHSSIMFRSDPNTFYRDKIFYAEDYDLYLCLLTNVRKITNIPEVLVKYRYNPASITFSSNQKQIMFANKAKEFYRQRIEKGHDDYDSFDPNEILNKNLTEFPEKNILKYKLKLLFKQNQMHLFRNKLYKYIENYGFEADWIVYYLSSFLPTKVLEILRKIIFH